MPTLSEIAKLLGSQGGKKRAENLSPERRKEIATKAVKRREELRAERKAKGL